jgi:hypothetical protein
MVLAIVATALILAIAYYQVVQGLFNALIMAILAVVCAALALNLYPAVSEPMLYARQGAYADAIALTALFVLPLLVARVAFDKIIARNVVFGAWADRIGGGALGILAGSVMVGVLMIVMEMLPFGESILGYRPYNDALQRDQRAMPFYPDDLAISLASIISRGALANPSGLDRPHEDLLRDAFCARNTAGKDGTTQAAPDSMVIRGVYEATTVEPPAPAPPAIAPPRGNVDWLAKVPPNPLLESTRVTKVLVVRATVDRSAMDTDEWFRLPGTHFRLVTRPVGGSRPIANYPVGYLHVDKKDPTRWDMVPAPVRDGQTQAGALIFTEKAKGDTATVWWVYRIGDKETLDHLAFRRVSQRDLTKIGKSLPPPDKSAAAPKPPDKPKGKTPSKAAPGTGKPKTPDKATPAAGASKTTTKPASAKPAPGAEKPKTATRPAIAPKAAAKPPAAKPPADSE